MLRSVCATNLLSFGPEPDAFELGPLNVFIGVNGSGKSNLIEVLSLLRASATGDLAATLRDGGGVREWLWKGGDDAPSASATIETVVEHSPRPLRHQLTFTSVGQRFEIADERVESATLAPNRKPWRYYRLNGGKPELKIGKVVAELSGLRLDFQKSILAQLKDPQQYPELAGLDEAYSSIRLYRNWSFGRGTAARIPQPTDLPNDVLSEDGRNLGLVLNRLRRHAAARQALLENIRLIYDGISDVDVSVEGATAQVFLHEGSRTIPATRLSDGTLRWLALLAILLQPDTVGLVCLEEPELGLHPDILPTLAKLLREASTRMQLVVTTHSDTIADALTDTPEAVVVCEKNEGVTHFRRLSRTNLSEWLSRYSLGELWRRGELGGNRW